MVWLPEFRSVGVTLLTQFLVLGQMKLLGVQYLVKEYTTQPTYVRNLGDYNIF